MPVRYETLQAYEINYDSLYNEIMEQSFLDDIEIQKMYLKKWMEELKSADDHESKLVKTPKWYLQWLQEMSEAPEIYSVPFNYKSNQIYIHFRISRLIEAIENNQEVKETIYYMETEEFTKRNSFIKWNDPGPVVRVKDTPIIMTNIANGKYGKLLVIDGNHRVRYMIDKKVKEIPYYPIAGQGLVDSNQFTSHFNKLFFIFQYELPYLAKRTNEDHISTEMLMNEMYFFSKQLKEY